MLTSKSLMMAVFCRSVVIVLCISLATGCTTLRPLPTGEPQAIREQIRPGDGVIVTTRDGTQQEITVKEVTSEQLVGESTRVGFSDIISVERREFSTWKTVGLTVGVVAVTLMGLIILLLKSLGPMAGP